MRAPTLQPRRTESDEVRRRCRMPQAACVIARRGMRRAAGDLYELTSPRAALSTPTWLPPRIAQRTWTTYHVASLWVGLSVCIPTYMLAAGLVGAGMNWKQAIFTIMLGNLIVCVPMVLIAHAGTRYGIPFPVLARASFGIRGLERARAHAGARRLRLVRHPDVDRRPGDLHDAARWPSPGWEPPFAMALGLRRVLALEHGRSSCAAATRSRRSRHGRRRS